MCSSPSAAEKERRRLTAPPDCALLVAVPLTREAFLSDVEAATATDAAAVRGDYAFGMVSAGHDGDAEAAWRADGSPVAELCRDLIDDARAVGLGYVAEHADRTAFMHATRSGASVILLVAHWRGPQVMRRDLGPRLRDRLSGVLANPAGHSELRLAQCLAEIDLASDKAVSRGLNAFINAAADIAPDDARDELDALFAGDLVPGSCLELRDGYHKAAEVTEWIEPDWKGVVEFSVCHSIRLAMALKQGRKDRLVITNEAQKHPSRCLREMREAVLRLALRPEHYVSLRARIFREYSEMLRGKQACS